MLLQLYSELNLWLTWPTRLEIHQQHQTTNANAIRPQNHQFRRRNRLHQQSRKSCHLLNFLYAKVYGYKRNIKPAPNPHYTLNKFCGNLSIQEYRELLQNDNLLLVVDKPLTRILPELHEDNDDFLLNNKAIPSNTCLRPKRSKAPVTKNEIMNENFGFA